MVVGSSSENWSVSVVIPTYNRAEYLGGTVESVLGQTVAADEVIVVDDGSTDETARVLEGFGGRVRVIRIENNGAGPSRPRNVGIGAARGRYITLVDSDDVLLPTLLEEHRALLELRPDLGLVFNRSAVAQHTEGGRTEPVCEWDYESLEGRKRALGGGRYWLSAEDAYSAYCEGNYLRTATGTTFPRAVWEAVAGFDETFATSNDREFFFRVLPRGPVGYIERALHVYCHHEENISAANLQKRFKAHHYLNRLRVLERQLEVARRAGDRRALRESMKRDLLDLGYGYRRAGRYGEAFATYWKALRYAAERRANVAGLLKVPAAWAVERGRGAVGAAAGVGSACARGRAGHGGAHAS